MRKRHVELADEKSSVLIACVLRMVYTFDPTAFWGGETSPMEIIRMLTPR